MAVELLQLTLDGVTTGLFYKCFAIYTKFRGTLTHPTILVALYGFQRRLGQFDVQHGDSVIALLPIL